MPPSSAYVRPLPKSIRRLASSWSEPCRLRITGTPSLNRSAICCASLKLRGRTRCTRAAEPGTLSTPRRRRGSAAGRRTLARAGAAGSGSVQSSYSSRRPRRDAGLRRLSGEIHLNERRDRELRRGRLGVERVTELARRVDDPRLAALEMADEVPAERVAVAGVLRLEILGTVLPDDLHAGVHQQLH